MSQNPITCDGYRVHTIDPSPSLGIGVGMKRDEKALVILTIFTDQYPFMLLLSVHLIQVAPAVTISYFFTHFSLFMFSFSFFPATCFCHLFAH